MGGSSLPARFLYKFGGLAQIPSCLPRMAHLVPLMNDCYMATLFKKLVAEHYNQDEIKQVIQDAGLTFSQLIHRMPMEGTKSLSLCKTAEEYGITHDHFKEWVQYTNEKVEKEESSTFRIIEASMVDYTEKKDKTDELKMEISMLRAELDVYKNIALLKQTHEELQRTAEILASTLEEERAAKRARA